MSIIKSHVRNIPIFCRRPPCYPLCTPISPRYPDHYSQSKHSSRLESKSQWNRFFKGSWYSQNAGQLDALVSSAWPGKAGISDPVAGVSPVMPRCWAGVNKCINTLGSERLQLESQSNLVKQPKVWWLKKTWRTLLAKNLLYETKVCRSSLMNIECLWIFQGEIHLNDALTNFLN